MTGPVESVVVEALCSSVDLVTVSEIASASRFPRRRIRHQLDRLVDLGFVERAALADVIGALRVGTRLSVPEVVDGEPVYRVRDPSALAAYADGELEVRPEPA